jgi:hypothetical protein
MTLAEVRLWGRTIGAVSLEDGRDETIVEEVRAAVMKWPDYAEDAKVADEWREQIQQNHCLEFQRT